MLEVRRSYYSLKILIGNPLIHPFTMLYVLTSKNLRQKMLAMFSFNGNKDLGPDGFTTDFYKKF